MIFLAPMYETDAKQGFELVIVLKDKKESDAMRVIAETALEKLNKRSTAYKIAQRIASEFAL